MSIVIPDKEVLSQLLTKVMSPEADTSSENREIVARLVSIFGLVELASSLLSFVDEVFYRYGLTQPRFLIVAYLFHYPDQPVTPAKLADITGVRRATMTGFLEALEKKEWLIRKVDLQDRRQVLVELSEQGRSRFQEILPVHTATTMAISKGLTPDELSTLIGLMNKLVGHVQSTDLSKYTRRT